MEGGEGSRYEMSPKLYRENGFKERKTAQELIDYMDSIKEDLETRTADVAEEDKLTAYVAGVSYKGAHGFEARSRIWPLRGDKRKKPGG